MPQTRWMQQPAVVARIEADGSLRYLADLNRGSPAWVCDPLDGLVFPSFREANHVASDLPDDLKAFSLIARIALRVACAQPQPASPIGRAA